MEFALAPGAGFPIETLGDLDTYLGALAAAGFDAVSLGVAQLAGDPAGAARLVERHGLTCTDVVAVVVTRDDDKAMAAAEACRPAVDALGPRAVLTNVWTRISDESIDRLGRVADRVGVPLSLEFAPGGMPTIDSARTVVEALGRNRATILADVFHFSRGDSTWEMLETVPVEDLGFVQFDDALPAESDDYLHEAMDRRAWPGDGEFDLDRFASVLRGRGWNGVVSVEVLSEDLRALPIDEFARRAYETTVRYWR